MATRSPHNLISDLKELKVGEYLELETFGGGDYEWGKLLIERVDNNIVESKEGDAEEDDDIEDDDGPEQYTITSFTYPEQDDCDCDDDDDDCECEEDPDPEEEVSEPMTAYEVAEAVGDFAY